MITHLKYCSCIEWARSNAADCLWNSAACTEASENCLSENYKNSNESVNEPAADQHTSYEVKHLSVDLEASEGLAVDRVERSLKY